MMRLLANENFPLAIVRLLRALGHDVVAVGEAMVGFKDRAVMEYAQSDQRLITTFYRDYGELIYKYGFRPKQGVLYLRLLNYLPEEPGRIVHELLTAFPLEMHGRLTLYDGHHVRQRSY